jgi:SOS response regulatory protein OraA/RecX
MKSYSLLEILKESTELEIDERVKGVNVKNLIGGVDNFDDLSKNMRAAFTDLETAIGLNKNPIMLGSKKLETAQDIFNSIKDGSLLASKELGRVEKGFLKSVNTDASLRQQIAKNYAKDKSVLDDLVKLNATTEREIRNILNSKGYPKSSIDEIVKEMKINGNIDKSTKSFVRDPSGPSSGRKKVPSGWSKYNDEVLKKLKLGWKWTQLLKWGTGLGISGAILWYIVDTFGGADKPSDMPTASPSEWSTCVDNMISAGMGQGSTLDDGTEVVTIKDSTYPNGIVLYSNGTLKDLTSNKTGRWVCKEGDIEPIQESKKTFSLLDLILEQDIDYTLTDDVDYIRRYLDFPVTQGGLQNAYKILKKYYDNGKGLTFLEKYKESGLGGGSLEKTMKYIFPVNSTSKEIKNEIIKLIQKIREGGSQSSDSQSNANNVNDYINITWDGDGTQTGGGSSTSGSSYFSCENWDINSRPYVIGCKSSKIREIQKCLGFDTEDSDGKFGPNTKKALMDLEIDMSNGITSEIYNRIIKNCGGSGLGSDTGNQEPQVQQEPQEPQVQQEPSGEELQTGVDPLNFGEISFTSPQETGEQFYMRLLNGNRLIGSTDKRRIKYKDYPLSKTDYDKLTEFLSTKGFYPLKVKEKGDEMYKYVWKLSKRE